MVSITGQALTNFQKWDKENEKKQAKYGAADDPRGDFMQELTNQGFKNISQIIEGKLTRIMDSQDKGQKKTGWYVYHEFDDNYNDGHVVGCASFGSWRDDATHHWMSRGAENMSPVERQDLQERRKEAEVQRKAEEAQRQAEAAIACHAIYHGAGDPNAEHGYFQKKQITPCGNIKQDKRGLIIPMLDANRAITSLQYIDESGGKKYHRGGKIKGSYFAIEGTLEKIYVVEGYSTGASVHLATGCAVYCSFMWSNLYEVCTIAQNNHPEAAIVIAGDDDVFIDKNVGRNKAEEVAMALKVGVRFPEFADLSTKPTDWNDLHCLEGLGAASSQLSEEEDSDSIEKREFASLPVRGFSIDKNLPEIDPNLLPSPYSDFAKELSTATETPPEMAIACILAMISVAVTGKFVISPKKGWYESLNTYWFIELPPANLKSKVISEATRPLKKWEAEKIEEARPIIEKLISQNETKFKYAGKLRNEAAKPDISNSERDELQLQIESVEESIKPVPCYPRLYANNVTTESLENYAREQDGVFSVISDEGGVIETLTGLYSNGKANVDILLKGIDGGSIRLRRQNREFSLTPYLTILLCVQPIIREKMGGNNNLVGNGALERFLYLMPRSKLGSRTHNKPALSKETKQAYNDSLRALLDRERKKSENGGLYTETLYLSREAYNLFYTFQMELEPELQIDGSLNPLQGWGGKIVGFTLRIAGLLHIGGGGNENSEVDEVTLQKAITIAHTLIAHAKAAYCAMGMNDGERYAMTIYRYLLDKQCDEITRSDLTRAMRHSLKANMIDIAVTELSNRNILLASQREGTGSRDVTCYLVNSKIYDS